MNDPSPIWYIAATVAAAIAAVASAFAAFLSLRLQRQMSLDAVRPELILDEWVNYPDDEEDPNSGQFEAKRIQNIGRGPALHVSFELEVKGRPESHAFMTGDSISIIGPGEIRPISAYGFFAWEDSTPVFEHAESIDLDLAMIFFDSYGYCYETHLHLVAARGKFAELGMIHGAERLARELCLVSRRTFVRSPRRLRWVERMRALRSKFRKKKPPSFRPSRMKDEKG